MDEEGYRCVTATTGEDALEKLSMGRVDVVLLDLRLPGISGMDMLRVMRLTYPGTAVIIITGVGDAETAVEAMKSGAVDYITKPFEVKRVSHSIEAALRAAAIGDGRVTAQGEGIRTGDGAGDWARYLDDIAEGVETRLDSLTGHVMARAVIEGTTDLARSLDIPEEQIEKWADARRERIGRIGTLDSLLMRMAPRPVA